MVLVVSSENAKRLRRLVNRWSQVLVPIGEDQFLKGLKEVLPIPVESAATQGIHSCG